MTKEKQPVEKPDFDGFIKSCRSRDATHTSGERFGKQAQTYVEQLEARLASGGVPMIPLADIDAHIAVLQALREAQIRASAATQPPADKSADNISAGEDVVD
jgi:hypothetical protein